MVVLPLEPSFSSSSSASSSSEAEAAAADVEAGTEWRAGNSSSIHYAADDNLLSQPLLTAAAAARAPAGEEIFTVNSAVGRVGAEVHGHQPARLVSPDMLAHVGDHHDDVAHGQRDVAVSAYSSSPFAKGAAGAMIMGGSQVAATGVCFPDRFFALGGMLGTSLVLMSTTTSVCWRIRV
jgi:hypothetical protein